MSSLRSQSASPLLFLTNAFFHRYLIRSLIRREIIGRYRGSALGLLWSFFNPVLMLAVYTFVFSVVFKARWQGGSDSKVEFALVLFAGLMVFNVFSECINRAPTLIISNVNYVKKIIFPLELLPVVVLGSAFFHFLVSLLVWLLFCLTFYGVPPASIILLPVVLLPMVLLALGLSWGLASLGVYLRDVSQVVGVMTTVLLFLSPVFYPISALPEKYQSVMLASPLTYAIEEARGVLLWNKTMDWGQWTFWVGVGILVAWLGFCWFQKTRRGFADVL